ncbi:alpha-glucosidase [Aequitasia blattaphilus]|uniref:Alpha-glycosidase n=1 Tax=Aequitasia blattaphilus TaxID=2949332 RepID=A0ABT1E9P8_9FIRM|nr:alpha-glycosidase [Aequitasia blattaphilus]MCP1102574.1 alpha-glycosidase [Aequitasia blattaphilus]MCR8615214.1 alpha-glycosidase [Aequitasia blattaphilus]
MNKEALFCDGTSQYVLPAEPEKNQEVTFCFRSATGDEIQVYLVTNAVSYPMKKDRSDEVFDYYVTTHNVGEEIFRYHFFVEDEEEMVFYDQCGVSSKLIPEYAFEIYPGFSTPEWAKGAVMYQIFVDRFYNGDPTNDVQSYEYFYLGDYSKQITDWNKLPEATMGIREFYGGDIQGIIEKLDYLEDLGVEVLYLNPIFVSPSNHKYDIQDYEGVDPHYGKIVVDDYTLLGDGDTNNQDAKKYIVRTTNQENIDASNQLLATLVEELHKRGMRLILDGVFNHCGSFNKWLDRERIYEMNGNYPPGAYMDYESPYHDFFYFHEGEPNKWPKNGSYDGWWGHDTLPKLNFDESPGLEEKILSIGKKWIDPPFYVDGWRLDVAADLGGSKETNHDFWKKFRKVVKESNPEAIILAEHYGDPKEWLQGDEWDTIMNYDAFMEPVSWYLTGMEKHSEESRPELLGNSQHFINSIKYHMTRVPTPALYTAMNELSNHDHSRFLTRTNHVTGRAEKQKPFKAQKYVNYGVMRQGVVLQMTWIGAPTIYYGDEAGVFGFTDPDNRRTYPWGNENEGLISFHKEMIRIHKEETALRTGSLLPLYCEGQMISFGRFDKKSQIVVVINAGEKASSYTIPVWKCHVPLNGRMKRILYSYEEGYVVDEDEYLVENGEVSLNMGAYSAILLKPV